MYNSHIMKENWKQVEESVNQKEVDVRSNIATPSTVDLPPELQAYITETITNDVELSNEESALADLRIENVKTSARAFHVFDKKLAKLKEDRRKFEEKFLITSAQNRPPQIIEAMKKINAEIEDTEKEIADLTQSNPEAYVVRNALELRNYRKQLRFEGFVLTPYAEKKLEELQDNYYAIDKIPFLNGETGSGKSSVAKYFVEEVLGTEPERIAGAKGIDETKIFGKIDLTSDEKGPQALFVRGPLYRAMEKGVPLIIEEVNAIPPEILKSLNDIIINAKKGEEVAVIGDPKGSKVKAKDGFGVIMTGNLNRNPKAIDRYKGLFELSADFVNRIRPIDYDYLPQSTEGNYVEGAGRENELYTLMIAMVMNDKGDVNAPDGAFDDLWRLAKFTRKIQEVYSGQRDGKLFSGQAGLNVPVTATSSVISMRDVKQVIESWKRDNFEREFDYYIYKELIAPLTNAMDIKFFVQQLQAEGFFADGSWKTVISKAGTFDSAIHAPENKGKDLEFTTVRGVVENVYGRGPERTEFPYDIEALKKNEGQLNILKNEIAKVKRYAGFGSAPLDLTEQLNPVLEEANNFLSRMEKLTQELEDSLKKGDKEKIKIASENLKELESVISQSLFSKIAKELKDTTVHDMLGGAMSQIEATIESERNLSDKLKETYTENFKIDENFVAYHSQYLKELMEQFPPSEIKSYKEREKKRLELTLRIALGDSSAEKELSALQFESISSMSKLNTTGKPFVKMFDGGVYPNLPNNTTMSFGAQNAGRFNPEMKDNEDKFDSVDIKKVEITLDQDVEDIFNNAEVLFRKQEHVSLNRFYKKGWEAKIDEKLELFSVSINNLNSTLSGFIYSEPWMIKSYIYGEEAWRKNDYVKESFSKLYKDPVIFCVQQKDGTANLIEVRRVGDLKWKIFKVGDSASTCQFIAPQVAPGY